MTISAAIFPISLAPTTSIAKRIFATLNSNTSDPGWAFDIVGPAGNLRFVGANMSPAFAAVTANGAITTGGWQFVVVSVDGVNCRLYKNGVLIANASRPLLSPSM